MSPRPRITGGLTPQRRFALLQGRARDLGVGIRADGGPLVLEQLAEQLLLVLELVEDLAGELARKKVHSAPEGSSTPSGVRSNSSAGRR
jgi:hypothetical protein